MAKDEILQSFPGRLEGRIVGSRCDLIWRTRVLSGTRAGTGITLAIDVNAHLDWAPRGVRRPLSARALQLVVQATEAAVRDGFWAELRPAEPCHDPEDDHWSCAAVLHLVRHSPRREPDVTPTLPEPMPAYCPVCRG